MSYCRFSDGDVYAYACVGGVQFWVAGNADKSLDRLCNTYNEAYQYAKALRDGHGLDVPSYAIEALREDAADEAERYFGPNGVVAELRAENVRLRELVLQLWECPVDDNKCTDCPHCKEHYDVCAGECGCKLYDRMRELGVGA